MKMYGQWTDCDSLSVSDKNVRNYDFEWRQTILPASLIGVGAVALAPSFIRNGSRNVTRSAIGIRGDGRRLEFDDYIQYLPVAGSPDAGLRRHQGETFIPRQGVYRRYLLCGAGRSDEHPEVVHRRKKDRSFRDTTPSLRGIRPPFSWVRSLVRIEYGGWYGAGAYAVAAGVGFMRMYNGRHWLHDVVAGAGVGILSARIGE